jgi:hypothetical protein
MSIRRKPFLFLLILPMLISCSSKNYFISPEYRGKVIDGADLVIPTVNEVKFYQFSNIFNEGDIEKIKKDFSSLLSGSLKDELKSGSNFSNIKYASFKTKPDFERQDFNLNGKEKISFELPKNRIESDISGNLFFLFLEDISLSLVNKESDTSDPAKHYSVTATPGNDPLLNPTRLYNQLLVLDLRYCLYDNNSGRIVSYGKFSDQQKFGESSVAEKLIRTSIEKFADKVFENTPFEKN